MSETHAGVAKDPAETVPEPTRVEVWVKLSVALAAAMAIAWIAVFLRMGIVSVQIHAMVVPTLGALTLVLMAVGLVLTVIRPPVLRRSRTLAFGLLLLTGFVGNVPLVAPPVSTTDWKPKVAHFLPFDGKWLTIAGGDAVGRNYKATTAAFRWAYSFTKFEDGSIHRLDGKKNEDFHCWGEPLYAPAPGTVVEVVADVVDNVPGEVASESIFGNHVVIRVSGGEYLFVAHMKHQSVEVAAGDEVTHDTVIGACGNSGRSLLPHVHVHAQDRQGFPIAQGLPLRFEQWTTPDGEPRTGMPRGETAWEAGDGDVVKSVARR